MPEKNKIISFIATFALIAGFSWVSAQLFLETETEQFLASVKQLFVEGESTTQLENLRVMYPIEAYSLEPTLLDPHIRERLINIYEPLVKSDRDLNMRPALALSWGQIDDLTWEFKLRKNVVFHDGTKFDVQDAVASVERAVNNEKSELSPLLTSIEEVEVVDDFTLRIKTYEPDPLLLQRLSTVLIIPFEAKDKQNFLPIATGPYKFDYWEPKEKMVLQKNENYWGTEPKFKSVELLVQTDKSKRVNLFLDGKADVINYVPYDAVEPLAEREINLTSIPSLEVQFLVFNLQSKYFKDLKNRQAFSLAVDQKTLIELVGGYAREVSQFVSNGVFGFNPEIAAHEYDLEKAGKIFKETGLKGKTVLLDLPLGLDVLGEHVRKKLAELKVNVVVSYLNEEDLFKSYDEGKADLYFFGFRADLGDSSDFFTTLVDSEADFNVGAYKNEKVDQLISSSLVEIDSIKRLKMLQEIGKIIASEDLFGVPLFEYERIYAFQDYLELVPRIDGFIYFDELTKL